VCFNLKALADAVGGEVLGDLDLVVTGLRAIDEATAESICPLFRKQMLSEAPVMPAAVVSTRALGEFALSNGIRAALVHEAPQLALAGLIDRFHPPEDLPAGAHPGSVVHSSAQVHPSALIGAFAVIEKECVIGADCVIGPSAVICRGSVLGARVRIGPGAVIGHEGFGFVPTSEGPKKVRQVGRVVIDDDVEIGANACIDRGTLGATRIGRGTKIDNLVQIGHNALVGSGVLMAGQVGIAGSCRLGDRALIGGQAGIADHLTVGAGARIAAKSGVTRDVEPGETVAGYPAMARAKWLKVMANLAKTGIVDPDTEES
jgi:UDP-3-O-[3-hydroxymyristoyl] glucosamine N-acyltransferase